MDLRNQEEQICQWLESQETEDENEDEAVDSTSETEDNLEADMHQNTDSESDILSQPSESDDDDIRPSKRQRTRILDSDDSSDENVNTSIRETSHASDNSNPRVLNHSARFLYGKNKHKWSTEPRSATSRTLRRNIVHFIPGPRGEARDLSEPKDLSINAYSVHVANSIRNKKKPVSRRDFVMKLGDQLMEPWLQQRLNTVTLRRDIKAMIQDNLGVSPNTDAPVQPALNVRKICYLCPSKARRMTKHYCIKCKKAICGSHNVDMCAYCAE